ncbi:MAG: deoxyribodipyrimidine photo-lyase, partial [Alphaproteobacteria bacterium]|nr:deoxyribodipyrimidine photo-lyase [Alphaproteobacteria bacterium]
MWFRRDLRLSDNPALAAAINAAGSRVICVYIRETNDSLREMGGASKWWLDKSLRSLTSQIEKLGGRLILRSGDAETQLA